MQYQLTGELVGDVDDDVLVDVGRALHRVVAEQDEYSTASTSRVDGTTIALSASIRATSFTEAETLGHALITRVLGEAGIADNTNFVGPRAPGHPRRSVENAGTELVLV